MKVMFLARSLDTGGAERQLVLTARGLAARHSVMMATFYDDGPNSIGLGDGAPARVSLRKAGRWDVFGFLWRFLVTVRRERPDVIYAFTGAPSLVALAAKLVDSRVRVVWGIRASKFDLGAYGLFAVVQRMAERALSRFADLAICNSEAGLEHIRRDGFAPRRMIVIGNGIDTDRFKPQPTARAELRARLGISSEAIVVGTVARLDPLKGLEVFLEAAAKVAATIPTLRLLVVGGGPAEYHDRLRQLSASLGIAERVVWAGHAEDVVSHYAVMDLFASTSVSEGFSNALGEAMACALPCVATDVGDSARILGSGCGRMVAPDAAAVAAGWSSILAMPAASRTELGQQARRRVEDHFSVERMLSATESALAETRR